MTFRKTGKLLTLVGFVICLSLLGILYGNLSTITEERDHILVKKNEIKHVADELNTRISSLQEKITRLESSLNQCNAAKLEAEEGKSLLQQETDTLKSDIEYRKISDDNVKSSYDQEIQQLKAQLTDTELDKSSHKEESEACQNTNEDLLAQLNAGKERTSQLEKSSQECEIEKRRLIQEALDSPNKEPVDQKEEDSKEVEGGNVNPVAAVPAPVGESGFKDGAEVDIVDHVADIPEAPKDNSFVDTNQAIPEAQAPAPGIPVEQPVVPGDIGGAVAPAPGAEPVQEFKRDIEDQLNGGMGGFQPLQPIPDAALAESLDRVRQEEQLEELQERQNHLQPEVPEEDNLAPANEDQGNDNNIALQPALPPEMQAAQPAPNGENESESESEVDFEDFDGGDDDDNDSDVNGDTNSNQDNVVDNEVQLGLLPELVPAQPAPNV